jgi:hypothetical protein
MATFRHFLIGMLCVVGLAAPAVADVETRVFALVVTSNRGTSAAQTPLAYADDDGARYFQLFRAAAKHAPDVVLLTTFDTASRAAFPELVSSTRPPVQAELLAAISALSTELQAARARGESTNADAGTRPRSWGRMAGNPWALSGPRWS